MKRNHSKSLLTLCAGLVLCLCMTSCNADVTINVGDVDINITDTDNAESEEDENEKEEDTTTQNQGSDDDPNNPGGDGDTDPTNPGGDDDPDPENPNGGGDTGDDNPNPDDPSQGGDDNPNPDPENPDEGGDDDDPDNPGGDDGDGSGDGDGNEGGDDEGSDVVPDPEDESDVGFSNYQPYSFVFTSGMLTSTGDKELTSNGLTWHADKVTAASFSSGVGVRIGSTSNPQTEPWTFTTNFGENVELRSVVLYVSNASSGTAHYEISFNEETLGSGNFSSSSTIQRGPTRLSVVGSRLTISMNAVDAAGFYLQAVTLAVYTREDSKLSLSYDTDYEPNNSEGSSSGGGSVTPDNPEDYTYYQNYAYKFAQGDLSSSGGTLTKNGLTWTYDASPYIGWDGQYKRGIQIGSTGNPQYEPWTITADFGETIELMDVTVYLYTATGGNANVSVSLNEQDIGSEDFSTTSTESTGVYLAEYTELEYFGDSFTITLKSLSAHGFYLKAISLNIYTTTNTNLTLVADSLEDEPYEPTPVVPGENNVLKTNSDYTLSEEEYYEAASIDWTLTGDDLRTSLRESYSPVSRYEYDDIRYMLPYVDEDPNDEGYMYGAYDGDELPAYWDSAHYDREHVWPCAHMKLVLDDNGDYRPDGDSVGHYSDLHNLRICCKPVNNYKSDKYFYTTNDSYNFFPNESDPSSRGNGSHSFSPADYYEGDTGDHRGDVARICLYMYTMYEELSLEDGLTSGENPYNFGQLKTLLLWNYEDEPDDFEIQRNNRIYEYQGNRNPFIDYPELADYLFPNETQHFIN